MEDSSKVVVSGVEELIERLRDEGVQRGLAKAENLVAEAKLRAREIVAEARKEAETIVKEARAEAEDLRRAGADALSVAGRDTLLDLKTQLTQTFAGEVRRLVQVETSKPELLRTMILEVAGNARNEIPSLQDAELLLPRKVSGFEELTKNPEELEKGILTQFVKMISHDMLEEGIKFGVAKDDASGLKLYLKNEEVTIDLSDEAIAAVLLQHLQPRFRALMEGIVGK